VPAVFTINQRISRTITLALPFLGHMFLLKNHAETGARLAPYI